MRIDNHMAGHRPPSRKFRDKGVAKTKVNTEKNDFGLQPSPPLFSDNFSKGDSSSHDTVRQKVHKRSKLEKAVYVLTTHNPL